MLPLTKRQKEILDYIEMSTNLNGYAPSLQEIRDHFNLKAISTVHEHLENLKAKGYIKKEMNQARGIQVTSIDKQPEYISIKVKGKIEDKVYKGTASERKTIVTDNFFVSEGKNFYSFEVSDSSLDSLGYKSGDFLVVSDSIEFKEGDICVQQIDTVLKIDKYSAKSQDIVGKIVCLVRGF